MSKFLKINKDLFLISLLITLSLIINHVWISINSFTYSDYGYMSAEPLKQYLDLSSWNEVIDLGFSDVLLWKIPILSLHGVLGYFGLDTNITDKFLVMLIWIVISTAGSYLLTKRITDSRIGGVIGSVVFCYNTYFISINTQGHFNISIAAAFGLFSIYFLLNLLNEKFKFRTIFMCALSLFITGIYDLRVLYLFSFLYFLFYIYSVTVKIGGKYFSFKEFTFKIFCIYILLFIYNLYWIFPIISGISINSSTFLNRGLFGEQFWKLSSGMTLFHPFWNGSEPLWFQSSNIPWYFFLITILAFSGLYVGRKSRYIVFFALVSFIGIFMSKQTNDPFGFIYIILFNELPGFNAFREATKFYIYIALGYSILIPAFWVWLDRLLSKIFIKKDIYRSIMFALFCFPFLLNTVIIFNGKIGSTYESRIIPNEYFKLENFLLGQPEYYRILAFPTFTKIWLYTSSHPWLSAVNMLNGSWGQFVSKSDGQTPKKTSKLVKEIIRSKYANRLFDQSSLRYVLIPPNELEKNDIYSTFYDANRDYYIDLVDSTSILTKTNISFGEITLYENKGYRPHIYATLEPESLKKDITFSNVPFSRLRKAEYDLKLNNVTKTTYVNFTDGFDSNWKIGSSDITLFDKLTGNKKFPDKFHQRTEAGVNSFVIDPSFVINSFNKKEYKINPDKSIDVNLRIYYAPDTYLLIGLMLSALAFSFSIAALLWTNIKLFHKLKKQHGRKQI